MMNRLKLCALGLVLIGSLLGGVWQAAADTSGGNHYQGAYLLLATEDNRKWSPAVAYDSQHDEYLVVWETIEAGGHHAIYGRRVSAAGQMYAEFPVYSNTFNSLQPAVAYDSLHDRYLVVWAYDSTGDGQDGDIYGRYIPWDGPSATDTQFGIDESRENSDKPRLAYSPYPDEFLVVWKAEADPSYIDGGIIFSATSAISVPISSGPEVRDFPDVTYNLARHEFVAVWDEDMGPVSHLDIYAVRLDSAGNPMPPGEFPVSTLPQNEQHPSVGACFGANSYFFVWQQQVNTISTDDNIFGRMMSGTGSLQQSYGVEGTTLPQQYPRLACHLDGNEYFLVWQDQYAQPLLRWGIWGAIIGTNFIVHPGFEVVRPSDDRDRLYPAVAYGKDSALVVWQHARDNTNFLDIWGQITKPHTVFMPSLLK